MKNKKILYPQSPKLKFFNVKNFPDYGGGSSEERVYMCMIWNVPVEQYVLKTLERTASFEPDKRSVVLLSHLDWPSITSHRLMWRRLGIIVPFEERLCLLLRVQTTTLLTIKEFSFNDSSAFLLNIWNVRK